MKTKIIFSFCCLLSYTSFSQDKTFQLKDYKYRTPRYRALVLSVSAGGGIIDGKNTNADTITVRNFNLFPTSINYNNIVSTDQKLFNSTISFNAFYNFYSDKDHLNNYKYRSGKGNFTWQFDDRFFKNNNWYWQLGNKLSGEANLQKYSRLYDNRDFWGYNELIFGFGKGRIEMVQDAQMALYILNDLKEQGLIDHDLNAETINSFAQIITQINTKRIFDFRRKRIYELTQIDSFLREKGIAGSTDIRQFTVINDNWSLGYNPLRSSGSDWFFHLVPFYEIKIDKHSNVPSYSSNQTTHTLGVRPEIGYENYKPINLKWQRNMGAIFSWSYDRHHYTFKSVNNGATSNFKASGDFTQLELNAFYGLGYYPNNRTSLNSSLHLTTSLNASAYSIEPSIDFSTDYFISYRTRLSAYLSALYQRDHLNLSGVPTNKTHNLTFNFSIGISHAFL